MPGCKQFIIEKVTVIYRDPLTQQRFEKEVNVHRYDMLLWGEHTGDLIRPGLAERHAQWRKANPLRAAKVKDLPLWAPLPLDVAPPPTTMVLQDYPPGTDIMGPVCLHEWSCNLQCV